MNTKNGENVSFQNILRTNESVAPWWWCVNWPHVLCTGTSFARESVPWRDPRPVGADTPPQWGRHGWTGRSQGSACTTCGSSAYCTGTLKQVQPQSMSLTRLPWRRQQQEHVTHAVTMETTTTEHDTHVVTMETTTTERVTHMVTMETTTTEHVTHAVTMETTTTEHVTHSLPWWWQQHDIKSSFEWWLKSLVEPCRSSVDDVIVPPEQISSHLWLCKHSHYVII